MPVQHEVLVSLDTDEPQVVSDIAAQLAKVGLDVRDVHDTIAVITGVCDDDTVGSLEQVPGVLDVETQRSFQLPPPDSDLQ